jgi:hypothetical protein
MIHADMAKTRTSPPLSIVAPGDGSAPPRKLGVHGMWLWDATMAEYDIADVGGRELLVQACAALDRAEALREAIDRDGEVITTEKGPKAHPALRDELASRAFVTRTLERLGLNVEAVKPPGRPPQPRGWTGPT